MILKYYTCPVQLALDSWFCFMWDYHQTCKSIHAVYLFCIHNCLHFYGIWFLCLIYSQLLLYGKKFAQKPLHVLRKTKELYTIYYFFCGEGISVYFAYRHLKYRTRKQNYINIYIFFVRVKLKRILFVICGTKGSKPLKSMVLVWLDLKENMKVTQLILIVRWDTWLASFKNKIIKNLL